MGCKYEIKKNMTKYAGLLLMIFILLWGIVIPLAMTIIYKNVNQKYQGFTPAELESQIDEMQEVEFSQNELGTIRSQQNKRESKIKNISSFDNYFLERALYKYMDEFSADQYRNSGTS